MTEHMKNMIDHLAAFFAMLSSLASNVVTFISASLAIIWYATRIYEYWKGTRKNDHK